MKSDFLVRGRDPERLLAVFHGWSRSAAELVPWAARRTEDVLVFSDYAELPETAPAALAEYREFRVLAWSLGVWAAAFCCGTLWRRMPDAALAVNGTLEPLSVSFGIAPEIFLGTAEHWLNPAARRKFEHRMGGPAAGIPDSGRSPENQQRELLALAAAIGRTGMVANIFTRAIVGRNDRIFPTEAQLAAWYKTGLTPEIWPEAGHWIWHRQDDENGMTDFGCNR